MTSGFLTWVKASQPTTGNALGLGGKMSSSSLDTQSLTGLS